MSLGSGGGVLAILPLVSHFSLTTRKKQTRIWGLVLLLMAALYTDCIPYGAAPGTTIEIKDLFYNTPTVVNSG